MILRMFHTAKRWCGIFFPSFLNNHCTECLSFFCYLGYFLSAFCWCLLWDTYLASVWLFCFIVLDGCCLLLYWYVIASLVSLVHHESLLNSGIYIWLLVCCFVVIYHFIGVLPLFLMCASYRFNGVLHIASLVCSSYYLILLFFSGTQTASNYRITWHCLHWVR